MIRDLFPVRRIEPGKQREGLEVPVRRQIDDQHQQGKPDHDCAGNTTANRPHRRKSKFAEHQYVIQRNVEQRAQQPVYHGRPGVAGAFTEEAQQENHAYGRCTPGQSTQIARRCRNNTLVDSKTCQQGLTEITNGPERHRQSRRDPKNLAGIGTGIRLPACSVELGYAGLNRHQSPQSEHQHGRPDSAANTQSRQSHVLVRQPAGHHCVNEVHAEHRQLANHHRRREMQRAADFSRMIPSFGYTGSHILIIWASRELYMRSDPQ